MAELQLKMPGFCYPGTGQDALGALDLSFPAGSFTAIVGPSGTGKSTLLHLLAGLQPNPRGAVDGLAPDLKQALMFQNPRLMPWLSVRDNLRLVQDGSAEQAQRGDALLERVGLSERAADYPGALSGGMQRRVALARAFCVHPALLLMDEPFVSLDEPTAQQLRQMLLGLCQESAPTVVFVTHNLNEALQLADRVLFLSAAPAQLMLAHAISQARPRDADTVQALQRDLLSTHPQLLSGALSP